MEELDAPTGVASPGPWEDYAIKLQEAGRYADALVAWDAAIGYTLGHNRAERYRQARMKCRELMLLQANPDRLEGRWRGNK